MPTMPDYKYSLAVTEPLDAVEVVPENKGKLFLKFFSMYWRPIFLVIYPLVCLPIMLCPHYSGQENAKFRCLYCVAIMAGFWVTECLPLPMTGLLPVFLFPVLNIWDSESTCQCYFKEVNMIFMGGLLLAICIENSNLHNRIALLSIKIIGCSPRWLHLGLMFITMFLSMWLVNSATCAMFCPIIKAILSALEEEGIGSFYVPQTEEEIQADAPKKPSDCTTAFYLGIAYAASIGGLGTLVGTPTNLAYKGIIESEFPLGGDIVTFLYWMAFNFFLIIAMVLLSWLWLQIMFMGLWRPKSKAGIWAAEAAKQKKGADEVMKAKYKELGPCTWHEAWVGTLFLICMLLWFFRSPNIFPGWGDKLTGDWHPPEKKPKYIKDSVPAFFILFLMLSIPAYPWFLYFCSKDPEKRPKKNSPSLVSWQILQNKNAWGAIFLLGGGFAIAGAGKASGLTEWLKEVLQVFKSWHPYLVMVMMTVITAMMTEITSNVAVCNIVIPVVLNMAVIMECNPMLLGVPVAIACSFAFMLPVGTPANTIIQGYANIQTKDMVKGGGMTKVAAIALTCVGVITWGKVFWDIDSQPDWLIAELQRFKPTTLAPLVLNATMHPAGQA